MSQEGKWLRIFRRLGVIADMVSDAVLLNVGVNLGLAGKSFGCLERLKDRGAVGLSAS